MADNDEILEYGADEGHEGLEDDDEAPIEQLEEELDIGAADAMQDTDAVAPPTSGMEPALNPGSNPGAPEAGGAAGAASDPLQLPPHGTEVYCANLDHEASEEQIRDFCVEAGQVSSMRVPKHPGGKVKGYAFVVYTTKEAAATAIATLNQTELKDFPGRRVRVIESQVKNRLFVGNLPKSMTQEAVLEGLRAEVVGVEDMDLMMDKEDPNGTLNRGFGFVSFYNNACADLALRKLTANEFRLGGRPLTVTWAEPKKNDNAEKEKVKSIYVGNLPDSVTEDKLRELFQVYGEVERVMIPPSKDPSSGRTFREYGFVHFTERASALKAVETAETDKPQLDGTDLQVHMARPQTDHRTEGYGQQGGYGSGYSRGGSSGYARGGGRGGYGRGRSSYGASDDYAGGGDDYDGYGGGATAATAATGAYGAAMGGFGFGGAGLTMVPMVLPNGQVGYMLSGTGAPGMMAAATGATGAAAGGPVRRAAGSYGGGYGSGGGGYGSGGRGGYSGRGGGRGTGGGGRYKPY